MGERPAPAAESNERNEGSERTAEEAAEQCELRGYLKRPVERPDTDACGRAGDEAGERGGAEARSASGQ